jgi:hypothetical protein
MPGAKALTGAQGCRQRLLRRHRAIPQQRRIETDIAVAARRRFLAKIVQQEYTPALRRFAIGEHAVELLPLDAFLLGWRRRLLDHLSVDHHIVEPVGHPGFRRVAVAPGAPGFLVIRFEALGQIEVGNEAHVGLVDPHPESNGGHHHQPVLAQESAAGGAGGRRPSARHGRARPSPLRVQPGRRFIDLAARQAIDDSGRTLMAPRKASSCLRGLSRSTIV